MLLSFILLSQFLLSMKIKGMLFSSGFLNTLSLAHKHTHTNTSYNLSNTHTHTHTLTSWTSHQVLSKITQGFQCQGSSTPIKVNLFFFLRMVYLHNERRVLVQVAVAANSPSLCIWSVCCHSSPAELSCQSPSPLLETRKTSGAPPPPSQRGRGGGGVGREVGGGGDGTAARLHLLPWQRNSVGDGFWLGGESVPLSSISPSHCIELVVFPDMVS